MAARPLTTFRVPVWSHPRRAWVDVVVWRHLKDLRAYASRRGIYAMADLKAKVHGRVAIVHFVHTWWDEGTVAHEVKHVINHLVSLYDLDLQDLHEEELSAQITDHLVTQIHEGLERILA